MLWCFYTFVLYHISGAVSQADGEFWWLKDKVKELNGKDIESASLEEVSTFETDETDKIVFSSIELDKKLSQKYQSIENERESKTWQTYFPGWNFVPAPSKQQINQTKSIQKNFTNINSIASDLDELVFYFPDEFEAKFNKNNTVKVVVNLNSEYTGTTTTEKTFIKETENICKYMDENQCQVMGGSMYRRTNIQEQKANSISEVCCVLPMSLTKKGENEFTNPSDNSAEKSTQKKQKRSTRSTTQLHNIRKKIVTKQKISSPDDDYEDPYANIRNYGQRRPQGPRYPFVHKPDDYVNDEYDDYADEVPKPGQMGVFIDQPASPLYWTDSEEYQSEEEGVISVGAYGQPNVNPRIDHRLGVTKRPQKTKTPIRNTNSLSFDKGSHIIRYHSTPNFHVMEGFKLLNLIGQKSQGNQNTERIINGLNVQVDMKRSGQEETIYAECGISDGQEPTETGGTTGAVQVGSHPWLGLAVRRRRPQQKSVCYATIVHPRAAVTAATCVYSADPGEVVFVTGMWDLNEEVTQPQRRIPHIEVHQQYTPGDIAYDVALLHWDHPLQIGENVRSACLGDPSLDDTCIFVGWNGKRKALRSRPHWQRASIWDRSECTDKPPTIYCCSVDEDPLVSGIGGGLLCRASNRYALVGVVVHSSPSAVEPVLLLPVRRWVHSTLNDIL